MSLAVAACSSDRSPSKQSDVVQPQSAKAAIPASVVQTRPLLSRDVPASGAGATPYTLDLGAMSVTAPLYETDCLKWTAAEGMAVAPSTPAWCQGDGFSISDNLVGGPLPKYYVPSASLTLQVDTSLKDDTSAMSFEIPDDDGTGTTIYREVSHLDGYVGGDQAVYNLTIQAWKPFCGSAPTPNCLHEDPNTYVCPQGSFGADNEPPIVSNTSPDGSSGCWMAQNRDSNGSSLSQVALYGSDITTAAPAFKAPINGTVSQALTQSVVLAQASTYLRAVVQVSLNDNYQPVQWVADGTDETCFIGESETECDGSCSSFYDGVNNPCPSGYHELGVSHPTNGAFEWKEVLTPFQVVVVPAALAQLKVLPYTIVYQPPGDASQTTFRTSTSYGVSLTAGTTTANTNGTVIENSDSASLSLGFTEKADNSAGGLAGTTMGWSEVDSDKWDNSTTTSVGRTATSTTGASATWTESLSFLLGDSTQTPGAKGPYTNEPFWGDRIALLIHPQMAIWADLAGQPTVSLLGARGQAGGSSWLAPTVRDLDGCYHQEGTYAAGYPVTGTSDVLTADDCYQLLQLDPFWTVGQSIPEWTGATLLNDTRAQFVMDLPYGIDGACSAEPCGSDLNAKLDELTTQTWSQSAGAGSTYSATVTSLVGNSSSIGINLSVLGFSLGTSDLAGENVTSSTKMDITYTQSVAVSEQSAIEITGSLDDHHGLVNDKGPSGTGTQFLGYQPHAVVYRDKMFGGYMFQDVDAPVGPLSLTLDGSKLTNQKLQITGVTGSFNSQTVQHLQVPAGTYQVQTATGALVGTFTVNVDGAVDYDASLDGTFAGRGTSTLTVLSHTVTLDGTVLTGQQIAVYGVTGYFDSATSQVLSLASGTYAVISWAFGGSIGTFTVSPNGTVSVDPASKGTFIVDGTQVIINPRAATIDATALTKQSIAVYGITPYFDSTSQTSVSLATGTYQVIDAAFGGTIGIFTVAPDGSLSMDSSQSGTLAINGRTVAVLPHPLTLDGTALTKEAIAIYGVTDYFDSTTPQTVQLPTGEFSVISAAFGGTIGVFTMGSDGTPGFDSTINGTFSIEDKATLQVLPHAVTLDASALSEQDIYLYGVTASFDSKSTQDVLVPAGTYIVVSAAQGTTIGVFTIGPDGSIGFDPSLSGTFRVVGRTVMVLSHPIDISVAIPGEDVYLNGVGTYVDSASPEHLLLETGPYIVVSTSLGATIGIVTVGQDGTLTWDAALGTKFSGAGTSALTVTAIQ